MIIHRERKTEALEDHAGHKRLHRRIAAARAAGEPHDNPLGGTTTTGWAPQCKCGLPPEPCVVMDIFSGAGTTLLAAQRLGRRGVGIEISGDYIELAKKRLLQMPLTMVNQ